MSPLKLAQVELHTFSHNSQIAQIVDVRTSLFSLIHFRRVYVCLVNIHEIPDGIGRIKNTHPTIEMPNGNVIRKT